MEGDLYEIINALRRIATALEKANQLTERMVRVVEAPLSKYNGLDTPTQ